MEELIIIGGGVAGLSCLNALLDRQQNALLIESARIGTPKICGEFISGEVVNQLQGWGISSVKIRHVHFKTEKKDKIVEFPYPAGAIGRSQVELDLMKRALKKGARIWENISVTQIIPPTTQQDFYVLHLSNNEVLQAKNLIVATGKFNQATNMQSEFIGIKFHMPMIPKHGTLLMHSSEGMYFGVVPVNTELCNCAALIKKDCLPKTDSVKKSVLELIHSDAALQKTFAHFEIETMDWLQGDVPEFLQKTIPNWPRAYWIGDALATLYPAIGAGFAFSVYTAILAAESYLKNNAAHYQKSCNKRIKKQLFYGKLMHRALLNPRLAQKLAYITALPWGTYLFLKQIGYLDNYFWDLQCNQVLPQLASPIQPTEEHKQKLPNLLEIA